MSLAKSKAFWMLCLVVLIAGATVFWMVSTAEPLTLVILFDDTAGIQKGHPVIWKTFTIGKVEAIEPLVENQIGVTISIKEDYASRITRGSTFTLKTTDLLGLIGQDAIEVQVPPTPGGPFRQGERIQGIRPASASLVEEGKQWTLEKWGQLKDQVSAMLEESRSASYRAELERALAKIKALAERGASEIRAGAAQLRKEHDKEFEDALLELERIRDTMSKKGDAAAAKLLDEQIRKLRERLIQ
jgi:hypothetical protein